MTKFLGFVLGFLISAQAFAGLPPTTAKGQTDTSAQTVFNLQVPYNQKTSQGGTTALLETGNANLLVNPSFEHTTANSGWTVTTATGSAETTIIAAGKKSTHLAFSSQTGNIAQSVTPGVYTAGQNWEASCKVYTTLTTAQVCSLAGGTEQNCVSASSSGTWQTVTSNFVGPANGTSVGVEVKTSSSTTGDIYVDDCYVGPARNVGSSVIVTPWYSFTPTITGFGTVSNLAAYYRQVGSTYEVMESFTAGTVAASIASSTLPNAKSVDSAALPISGNTTSAAGASVGEWTETGTSSANNAGRIVTAPGTSTSVVYFGGQFTGTVKLIPQNGSAVVNSSNIVGIRFTVPISGLAGIGTTITPDSSPASWTGYTTVSSGCATTSTTYSDTSACTGIALTQMTNRNFGTVTTAASSLPGIIITPPRAGYYQVCANTTIFSSAAAANSLQMVDSNGVTLNPGMTQTLGASSNGTITLCGDLLAPSTTALTVKLKAAVSSGTLSIANGIASGSASIVWNITQKDTPLASPYLTGSVTSTSTGADHIERALMSTTCTTGTCALASNSPGISSITWTATGTYSVNFTAGTFSAAPVCSYTTMQNSTASYAGSNGTVPTTSAAVFKIFNTSFAGVNDGVSVLCLGPR